MTIDSNVFDILTTAAANVYSAAIPPKALYPAVVYQRVSTRRSRSHDGTSLVEPLYQCTCWDTSQSVARQTARDVVAAFEPLLQEAHIENHYESYDPAKKLFGVRVDVRMTAHDEDAA